LNAFNVNSKREFGVVGHCQEIYFVNIFTRVLRDHHFAAEFAAEFAGNLLSTVRVLDWATRNVHYSPPRRGNRKLA
jgi:hypothetical protein